MSNPKNPSWYGGGLGGYLRPGANLGSVFYVDGNGPDTNSGLVPTAPKASITAALALCTNDHNDTIVVLDYWAAGTEAWPINVDKSMVSIIGVYSGGAIWPQVNPVGDVAAFNVTAAYTRIVNLSVNGGATAGCIQLGASVWGIEIGSCWFGEAGTGQDGIRGVAPFDPAYLEIWGCRFGKGLTRNGVRLDHNATRGMIGVPGKPPNLFRVAGDIAIYINNTMAQGLIHGNIIACDSNVQGRAITLDATAVDEAIIQGNTANFGDTVMVQNPYLDSSAAGSNTWLENMWGVTLTMPA